MDDYLDWLAINEPIEQMLVLRDCWNRLSGFQQEQLVAQFAADLLPLE